MFADKNLIARKHEILYYVSKYAWAGELEQHIDELPELLSPGPLSKTRCCVYKEREITRMRIKLAMGQSLPGNDPDNIIQVVRAACADCPISSYVVTENCQNCLGKACISSCRFGAISEGDRHSRIDPQKCKECGMCAKACPYNAIAHLRRPCKFSCPVDAITYDEYGISEIDNSKCIRCGQCIHSCPFGAIGSKAFIVQVINEIRSGRHVYAMVAPATEGQYGQKVTMGSWRQAMKEIGFTDMIEVGLGADLTAASEAEEWLEAKKEGKKKVTSCCPGFVNMVNKHFPTLIDKVSTTVSPMCAVSRMLKAKDPGCFTVFIGPCIAKKSEVIDQKIEGNADAVLTYSEVHAMMKGKDVIFKESESYDYQEASVFGKRFANSGGVTNACLQYMKELGSTEEVTVAAANGAAECKKNLLLLKMNRLPEDFMEGMACIGGCVGGPSSFSEELTAKRNRDALIKQADSRNIGENLKNYDLSGFNMHRDQPAFNNMPS